MGGRSWRAVESQSTAHSAKQSERPSKIHGVMIAPPEAVRRPLESRLVASNIDPKVMIPEIYAVSVGGTEFS